MLKFFQDNLFLNKNSFENNFIKETVKVGINMTGRPNLDSTLDAITFKEYYYLKEELVDFCRKNKLQTTGTKRELTERIAVYLDTGKKTFKKQEKRTNQNMDEITPDKIIETNFVCTQKHRQYYKNQIGKSFTFNLPFQKWLKTHPGKTYKESIEAYYQILEDKKKNKMEIDKQFEYNTYIRDFFKSNKDKTLNDAIKCWKYKKSLKGNNKYEKEDLKILFEE